MDAKTKIIEQFMFNNTNLGPSDNGYIELNVDNYIQVNDSLGLPPMTREEAQAHVDEINSNHHLPKSRLAYLEERFGTFGGPNGDLTM